MNQHMRQNPFTFIDIAAQRRRLGKSIDDAVARVLNHCQSSTARSDDAGSRTGEFSGAKHVVSCGRGTDAAAMVLMALNVVRRRRAVPSFTFCATARRWR